MITLLVIVGLIWGISTVVGLIYAFCEGVRAFKMRCWPQYRAYTATRCFLALNLCEPAINSLIVYLLLIQQRHPNLWTPLQVTAPMAVLLVPAVGLGFSDPFYRGKSGQILLLGLGRWALNLVVFHALYANGYWIGLLAILLGTGLLWYSVRWGKAQLDGPLAAPHYPSVPQRGATIPLPSVSGVALPVAASPDSSPSSPPVVPLDPAKAILCALCQAPTAPDADSCRSCGLVFLSRVPAPLQSLAHYSVLRPLGDGGMSSVYLARSQAHGHLCVLKTLASVDQQFALAHHAQASTCLRQEAALLGQLEHPQIVRVLDSFSDSHRDVLVLDYVAGPTLEQRLTRISAQGAVIAGTALTPGEALAYGAAVAEVLCYFVGAPRPLVHCDIKPSNLILPPASRAPVLIDFGGAIYMPLDQQSTVQRDHYGTPGYAAPEQYRGSCSPKSDIYGLAATIYHLLTDDDPSAHPLAFPALATLPPCVAAVLEPALQLDPAARPDAWQFSAHLRELAVTYSVPK